LPQEFALHRPHGAAPSFSPTLWGQSPKPETQNGSGAGLSFEFRSSVFFRRKAAWRPRRYTRISDFDLRIYAAPTTCVLVQSGPGGRVESALSVCPAAV